MVRYAKSDSIFLSIVFELLFSFLLLSFKYCAWFAGRFNGRVNIEPDSRSFIIDVKASWKKSIFQGHRWKTSVSWWVFFYFSFFLSCLDFTRLLMRENWRWITDTFFVRSSCSERRMRVSVTSTPLPMRTLPGRQNSDGSTWTGPSVRPPVEVERRYKLVQKINLENKTASTLYFTSTWNCIWCEINFYCRPFLTGVSTQVHGEGSRTRWGNLLRCIG